MAFTADTGDYKVTRTDMFLLDPRGIEVDWRKNLSRNGEEPPVDDALIELAKDMMPRKNKGNTEDGSSGQLNPVLVRPLKNRRLELIGGFRRMRAALYLIESGLCPDFKIKYTLSRVTDAEAALNNLSENMQREDPKPIQLAFAVRSLTEDYGMTLKEVAGRLKRSIGYLNNLLTLIDLPEPIQDSVDNGETGVTAALELTKLPTVESQVEVFNEAASAGEKVTAERVRQKRQQIREQTGEGKAVRRNLKQLREFLQGKTGVADYGSQFAIYLGEWLEGLRTDENLDKYWDRTFKAIEDAKEKNKVEEAA